MKRILAVDVVLDHDVRLVDEAACDLLHDLTSAGIERLKKAGVWPHDHSHAQGRNRSTNSMPRPSNTLCRPHDGAMSTVVPPNRLVYDRCA